MREKLIAVVAASAAFFYALSSWADVINQQLIQFGGAGNFALGQSLVTPAGGPWNNLTFNWFDTGGTPNPGVPNPIATGTLFLLSQEYLGTPAALSAASAGYIAQSQSIAGGMYLFNANVVIQPNTMYFFYTNQTVPNNSGDGNLITGSAYSSTGGIYTILPNGADARFRLQGRVTPEPSGILLAALGLAAGLLGRRRAIRKGLQ
jgi:hypothetical protein